VVPMVGCLAVEWGVRVNDGTPTVLSATELREAQQ
jgi:hypothetical protein